jgi:lysophospholipase L1-like esterase
MHTPLFYKIQERILENKLYTIAFIGDSITSASWIHPNWREIFEYVLVSELEYSISIAHEKGEIEITKEQLHVNKWQPPEDALRNIPSWNIRTLNIARDGSTTRDWLKYSEKRLGHHSQIDLAIVMCSANDDLFDLPLDETVKNLEDFFTIKEVAQIPIIGFATTSYPYGKGRQEKYSVRYKQIYQAFHNMPCFVDVRKEMSLLPANQIESFYDMKKEDETIDIVHPNIRGNCYIAKVFLKKLFGIEFDEKIYYEHITSQEYVFPWYSQE